MASKLFRLKVKLFKVKLKLFSKKLFLSILTWNGIGVLGGLIAAWFAIFQYLAESRMNILRQLTPSFQMSPEENLWVDDGTVSFTSAFTNNSDFTIYIDPIASNVYPCKVDSHPAFTETLHSSGRKRYELNPTSFVASKSTSSISFSVLDGPNSYVAYQPGDTVLMAINIILFFKEVEHFEQWIGWVGMKMDPIVINGIPHDSPARYVNYVVWRAVEKIDENTAKLHEGDECREAIIKLRGIADDSFVYQSEL